jgi:microcompartment protein CcmK/EutM
VPGTKLIRVAFETLGAEGDGAEVEVAMDEVGAGIDVEIAGTGLA